MEATSTKWNGNNSNSHGHNGGFRGNHSHGHRNGNHSGGNGQHRSNPEAKKDMSQVTCYKCKKTGHYANNCPEKKPDELNKPNPFQKGHVNHINVEEVMDEPDAVMGMFPLNSFTALVLFDTGASHSFISRAFVNKNGLPLNQLGKSLK